MAGSGACCAGPDEPKAVMKMGLSMVFIGHVNFLLGALVHGVVLRHVNVRTSNAEVVISNVVALTAGLVGIIVGILAIILSKNKKSRGLVLTTLASNLPDGLFLTVLIKFPFPNSAISAKPFQRSAVVLYLVSLSVYLLRTWSLFTVSLAAAALAAASAIGLSACAVMAIINRGRNLLTHCRFPDAIGYSAVTSECPFDPTRINSTALILWVPLVVTCVIQMVFSTRCVAVCHSFLGLPCCPNLKGPRDSSRAISVVRPMEEAVTSCYTEPPRSYAEPSTNYGETLRWCTAPPRQQRPPPPPPQRPPHQHRSLPPSERRPLHQPYTERSHRQRQETSTGSQQRPPERHHLLERNTPERSSFWI